MSERPDAAYLNEIMNAGELVLRQRGIDRASLADVARILDTSTTQLTFFAFGATPLWELIIARSLEKILAGLALTSNYRESETAGESLCAAMDSLVRASRVFQREDPALFAAYRSLSHAQAQAVIQFQCNLTACIEAIIARGVESHEFAKCDPWQTSWATLNAIAPFYDPRFGRNWSAPGEHNAYRQARASVLRTLVCLTGAYNPRI